MVEYIKQYIQRLRDMGGFSRSHFNGLAEELGRLDSRDFEPLFQTSFAWDRAELGSQIEANRTAPAKREALLTSLANAMDHYRGEGSRGLTRSFAYIADLDLRTIIERDYFELVGKLFPGGAWKSTVIMAGSVLEAILFDRLADSKWNTKAVASSHAKTKTGVAIGMKDWRLVDLIDIAVDIGMLPKDAADTIHQVLRDYRNFVHPKKEIRAAHPCTEAEAMLSLGALDSVCNYIESHP